MACQQMLDVPSTNVMLRCIGKRHQVQHLHAVLGNFLSKNPLYGTWHVNLSSDCQIEQSYTGAVDWGIGVQGYWWGSVQRIKGLKNQALRTASAPPAARSRKAGPTDPSR